MRGSKKSLHRVALLAGRDAAHALVANQKVIQVDPALAAAAAPVGKDGPVRRLWPG
jgi:hypothetical protein